MVAFSILIQALLGLMELFKVPIKKEGDYHVKQVLKT